MLYGKEDFMKKVYGFGMAALLCVSLFVLGGCPTEGEEDDGGGGGGGGGGGATTTDQDIAAIRNYLAAAGGGISADTPVSLLVELNLASGWTGLLDAIADVGKYVSLDLSACAMSSTTFAPGAADTGERRIVSLVLPDAATSIKASNENNPTFRYFSALKRVSGFGIKTVGEYAFSGRAALTEVDLPEATSIGDGAFTGCTALVTVSLPAATDIGRAFAGCYALTTVSLPKATFIGESAFTGCTALVTVSLPAATKIGNSVFSGCTALTTVSLPAATSIGGQAFAGCTALTTVSLGSAAPTLGSGMFDDINAARTVTVKVPSGATGYGTVPTNTTTVTWGNGFRGGGWTGSAFRDSSAVKSKITLKIVYQ
jgi:hypothetical protein